MVEETWEEAGRVLRGRSKVVGGDPYELRVVLPIAAKSWKVEGVEVAPEDRTAGVTIATQIEDGLVRARITSPANRQVSWAIRFSVSEK